MTQISSNPAEQVDHPSTSIETPPTETTRLISATRNPSEHDALPNLDQEVHDINDTRVVDDRLAAALGSAPPRSPAPARAGAFTTQRRPLQPSPSSLAQLVARWGSDVTFDEFVPPRAATTAPMPVGLPPSVVAALNAKGLKEFYSHQVDALVAAMGGTDVVVATPTASGKSLAYLVPTMAALADDPATTVICMFPTKALARDQAATIRMSLSSAGLDATVAVLDGDASAEERAKARTANVLITTPDMLHASVLPHHARWSSLLGRLRYVVIDELHIYDGLFGAHVANVIRRLRRVCRLYSARPTFITASATIGNPGEHASTIIGREVKVIDNNGAPAGARRVVVVRPRMIDSARGIYESHLSAAARNAADLARAGVATIVFADSRNAVEKLRREIEERAGDVRTASYRGGHLPSERRAVEEGLRNGTIRVVASTSALELGIDIGQFGAVVCAGYPGSVSQMQQRFGRAGRRQQEAICVFVPSVAPLDFFVAAHASMLMGAAVETARIDPNHHDVLADQTACAAFEIPFESPFAFGDAPTEDVLHVLDALVAENRVDVERDARGARRFRVARGYPAKDVKIRGTMQSNVTIHDLDTEKIIGELDFTSAQSQLHPGAVYLHDRRDYMVENLDIVARRAFVRRVKIDYDTTAMTERTVTIVGVTAEAPVASTGAPVRGGHGDVRLESTVSMFKKVKRVTHENIGCEPVNLPPIVLETKGMWVTLPADAGSGAAFEGLGQALSGVSAIGLMVASRDLGVVVQSGDSAVTICVYEKCENGSGLASRLFDVRDELLGRVGTLIDACRCAKGCPGCVGLPVGGEDRKAEVLALVS